MWSLFKRSRLQISKSEQNFNRIFNFIKFCYSTTNENNNKTVKFFFKNIRENKTVEVTGIIGQSLVDVSHKYQQDIISACNQSMTCSRCHIIVESDVYDKLDKPCEEEDDLLNLIFGLSKTSRLGCQIKVSQLIEGKTFVIPNEFNLPSDTKKELT